MSALNFEQYAKFKELISSRYGLSFSEDKKRQLESAVLSAFSESKFSNLDSYYASLANGTSPGEKLQKLVNMLTVGETHFYRNQAHINALRHQILPEIIKRNNSSKTLRIWSAGCSTGEEPYTIAMLLHEILPDINSWQISLLGSDINSEVLVKAQRAMYGDWSFRNTPESVRSSYFQSINGKYQLRDKIRRMVTFKRHNLMDFHDYPGVLDLILCRNVTIYFKREVIQKIAAKFHDVLVDGGWLLVGHSEPATDIYQRFNMKSFPGSVVYQKPDGQIIPTVTVTCPRAKFKGTLSSQVKSIPKSKLKKKEVGAKQRERASPLLISNEKPSVKRTPTLVERSTSPYETAVKLMDKSDYGRAVAKFQEQLQLQPTHVESYYRLALIHQQQEEWDDAIDMLKKAIYIERHFVLGHFILANLYRKTGKRQLAKKYFENTAELLSERQDDEIIPNSDGLTVGRLASAVSASLGNR